MKVTARTRSGCHSSSKPGPRQENVKDGLEEDRLRELFCAPVNKCYSPVCVVFVCSQLSYDAVDHCCFLELSANPTTCSVMSLSSLCVTVSSPL